MFKRIYDDLIAQYVKRTGKQPEGIDLLKLKLQAQEEVRQAEKIVQFKARPDSPFGKPGGWMPTKEEAEGIMSRLQSDIKEVQGQAQELADMGGKQSVLDFMLDYFNLGKKAETEAEMAARMNKQNKEAVERLKKKKEKKTAEEMFEEGDYDPSGMKDGGRIKYAGGTKRTMILDMLKRGADVDTVKEITGASDAEIEEAITFFKYGEAGVPLPTFDESGKMIDDGLYKGRETRPENKAKGGLSYIIGE